MSGREQRTASPSNLSRQSSIRSRPGVLNGLGGSLEDKNSDYLCPICFNIIEEAYVTRCGHTFCFACISKSIEIQRRCPKCGFCLTSQDHIFPNVLLNELITKYKLKGGWDGTNATSSIGEPSIVSSIDNLKTFVASESQNLSMPDVDIMLEILNQRKKLLEAESCTAQNRLLYDFLKHLYRMKDEQKNILIREVGLIKKDMEEVDTILKNVRDKCPTMEEISRTDSQNTNASVTAIKKEMADIIDTIDSNVIRGSMEQLASDSQSRLQDGCSYAVSSEGTMENTFSGNRKDRGTFTTHWNRMHEHFNDFVKCYFACRSNELHFGSQNMDPVIPSTSAEMESTVPQQPMSLGRESSFGDQRAPQMVSSCAGLDTFRENLVKFSRFKGMRPLATLTYSSDVINFSTIVSTIEFDKDNEFFAIAGVTKRIKVFDYSSVVRDMVDIHYPCVEMSSSHKISCVSWNYYHKGVLASSDYEGTVTIWDVTTGQRTKAFQEHDKRCWSVHFNSVDVRLLASGSDDARVKLWTLNVENSIATLEAKFNVCCVRFNSQSSCHLAFGSADHCVHYYDLRNMKEPLSVFKDHKKAVSYVKFLNSEEIVSASTDSQLKMWNINSPRCVRSFTGHANEKNFVGLATDGDYIACGSENNALFVYYKGLTKELFHYKFDAVRSFLEQERKDDEQNEFVSAVCWKQNSNVVVAANSQGTIKVLELI